MQILKTTLLLSAFLLLLKPVIAQDKICQTWYTDGKASAIEIYRGADEKYYGKIVWLREDLKDGKPMLDTENPDKTKRGCRWLGLQIITGLTKKSATEYVSGKIYDPSKGNYYDCKMTVVGNKLELRGYILGLPFLGRTTTWTLKEESLPASTPASSPAKQSKAPAIN